MADGLKYGVSLYCFSNSFHTRQLDLEGCIKRAKEIGYNGATLVAAQSCEEYPFPSDKWLFKLRDTMEKYEVEPVCWEGYLDVGMRNDRDMSPDEIREFTRNDIIYAHKAGFHMMKSQHSITPEIFESMRPFCEKMDVKLCIEMHHPHHPLVPVWAKYFEAMERSDGWLGICPDMSIFQHFPHGLHIRQAYEAGARPEKVEEILQFMRDGKPESELGSLDLSAVEKQYAEEFYHKNAPAGSLDQLEGLLKYTHMIHGKFYYLADDQNDPCIPYDKIMPIIKKAGYDGYLIAEYEGHHFSTDEDDSIQLHRYWSMVKRMYDNA